MKTIINKFLRKKGFVLEEDLSMSALDIAIDTAAGNNIQGDYIEFGVFEGKSLIRAFKQFEKQKKAARSFIACDSFEGLPESKENFKPSHYTKGEYGASLADFKQNVMNAGVQNLICIEGYYDKSLNQSSKEKYGIKKVAVAYIDVDLYESAVPVFEFLTDLIDTGSIIVIDDWFRHLGLPSAGIQKACSEWLEKNKNIELTLLHQYRRVAFIVNKK